MAHRTTFRHLLVSGFVCSTACFSTACYGVDQRFVEITDLEGSERVSIEVIDQREGVTLVDPVKAMSDVLRKKTDEIIAQHFRERRAVEMMEEIREAIVRHRFSNRAYGTRVINPDHLEQFMHERGRKVHASFRNMVGTEMAMRYFTHDMIWVGSCITAAFAEVPFRISPPEITFRSPAPGEPLGFGASGAAVLSAFYLLPSIGFLFNRLMSFPLALSDRTDHQPHMVAYLFRASLKDLQSRDRINSMICTFLALTSSTFMPFLLSLRWVEGADPAKVSSESIDFFMYFAAGFLLRSWVCSTYLYKGV